MNVDHGMSSPEERRQCQSGSDLACSLRRPCRNTFRDQSSQWRRRLRSPDGTRLRYLLGCKRGVLAALCVGVFSVTTAGSCHARSPAPELTPNPDSNPNGTSKSPISQLIPWLLHEESSLRGIPFAEIIGAATGKKVIPVNLESPQDRRVIAAVGKACDETLRRLNADHSPVQGVPRINEVSSHVEDALRELLNTTPGLTCDFPQTANDKVQRSGYPDLRVVDAESKRVFYLDPKLYAAGSRDSSFRTFYFEPKAATNKVQDDAVHLIAGLEHEPKTNGRWRFTRWDLVDLSKFRVKLKAEFQGSNRDMYRPEAIVASSADQPQR